MDGVKSRNEPTLLWVEETRLDKAVFGLYPGGDLPDPEKETERTQKELALSSTKREVVAFYCLSLAHDYMHEKHQTYQQLAREKSPQHGMREDDVLVSVLHQLWAGCYNNAMSLPDPLSVLLLSSKEAENLLKRGDTPERFSMQTVQIVDQAIRRLAEAEFPDGNGLPTYSDSITAVVGAACLVFIFELIIFFVRRLPNSSHKAPQGGSKTLDATESATQNMAPRKSSLQQEGPSEEKVKAVDVQEMRTCIQRSGGSRRTTTTGSPKGASRAAPQRTS